jgi:sigma-B regulation protein RsbU (phosphoserine phosphatase)
MAGGNFGVSVVGSGTVEVKELSKTFNYLGGELRRYMKNIESELVKKNSMENEMKAAREIQQAILPRVTSVFKERGIDLFAKLAPAKDVAGDFYDFFYLSKDRIVILIADVSGKGISASFFMSVSKRVLRNACLEFPDDPSEAMSRANNILTSHNIKMFVTVFLIYYDIPSGEIKYANAGHNEPIIIGNDGKSRMFGNMGGLVAGFFPDIKYKLGSERVSTGDILLLYTDGVVEARGYADEMFGEKRLLGYLNKSHKENITEIVEGLFKEVHEFEKDDQFDDITVLAMKR